MCVLGLDCGISTGAAFTLPFFEFGFKKFVGTFVKGFLDFPVCFVVDSEPVNGAIVGVALDLLGAFLAFCFCLDQTARGISVLRFGSVRFLDHDQP